MKQSLIAIAEAEVPEKLNAAAEAGNIGALYALIREDPGLLKRIDEVPFVDTPLHIAASRGHTDFAMEMVTLMPSYAKKLNPDGYSPLHLALLQREFNTKLVLCLIKHDKDLIRVKGRSGETPLHHTVARGNLPLLKEFLEAHPKSIEDVTNQGETALHIALKNDKNEAFKYLVHWLQRSIQKDAGYLVDEIVNTMNNSGNSVLHIAASKNQAWVVKLLSPSTILVDVKAKNMNNLTPKEIAKKSGYSEVLTKIRWLAIFNLFHLRPIILYFVRKREKMSDDTRNALLVVFTLVATANFDATLSPPGGLWQGQASNDSRLPGISVNFDTHNHNTITAPPPQPPPPANLGKVIMDKNSFDGIWYLNTTSLMLTYFLILFLFPSDSRMFLLPLVLMFSCYALSMSVISPSNHGYLIPLLSITIPYLVMLIGDLKDFWRRWTWRR